MINVVWSIVYMVSVLVANYVALWFVPFPVFGMLSMGTLVFGVTFTARDYVHRLGREYVYIMIVLSGVMSTVLALATVTPMRIVIASFITILIAETVDTEVYQRFIKRGWMVRVGISNAVSVPVDSILFRLLAFAGVMPAVVIVEIVFADIVAKWLVGVFVAWLRYIKPMYAGFAR